MELKPGIFYCGVQDPGLRVFDIVMKTPHGSSYNAYLIKGGEKTALVETAKDVFWDEYLNHVNALIPIEKVDYLIVNHTEPDHAGSIGRLLALNPGITLVGSNSAMQFVSHIVNREFNKRVVKAGDTLDLGGRVLSFHPAPNLHWPDTMFTFDGMTETLFTCDFFGAHYSFPQVLLSKMQDKTAYHESQRFYFDAIMSPFARPFALNGVKTARALAPKMICTGHGPVIDCEIDETMTRNEQWASPQEKEKKSVVIAYVSAYGYTRRMAEIIFDTLNEMNLFNVRLLEVTDDNRVEVTDALLEADGILLGTPTILGDCLPPMLEITSSLHPPLVKGKVASAFGSYGWTGEGVPNLMERLCQSKMKTIEGLRVRFCPSEEETEAVRAFARSFAEQLK